MKRSLSITILIISFILILALTVRFTGNNTDTSSPQRSDKEMPNIDLSLKGSVKSCFSDTHTAKMVLGKIEKDKIVIRDSTLCDEKGDSVKIVGYGAEGYCIYNHKFKYNDRGYLVEEDRFYCYSSSDYKIKYKYDNKGNLIQKVYYDTAILHIENISEGSYDLEDYLTYSWTYKYDDRGNKIEELYYNNNDKFHQRSTYKYDERGNKIEDAEYKDDNVLQYKYTYKYNDRAYLVEEVLYGENNTLIRKSMCKYDNKGNEIEASSYRKDNRLFKKSTHIYDDSNHLLVETHHDEGGMDSRNIYKYDDRGNVIQEANYVKNMQFPYISRYKYDEDGKKIEETHYDQNGTLDTKYTFTYTQYDIKGNWRKAIITDAVNGEKNFIVERKIEYYD